MSGSWQQEERLFLHLGSERETGGSGKRYFSRGGVKFALLELLEQEDMHGYQMMKTLEEQSDGTYKPSAGSVYPTLQMLRDQDLVTVFTKDGKRIFHITDEGRAYLREEKERSEAAEFGDAGWEPREQPVPDEEPPQWEGGVRRKRRLTPQGKELLHLLKAAERAALADPARAEQLRALLDSLRISLRQIAGDAADDTDAVAVAPGSGTEGSR